MRDSRLWAAAGALLLAALSAPAKEATTYGDIAVAVEVEPRNDSQHGYAEYVFTVANRSREHGHRVTLTLPRDDYGGFGDHLRSVSRTVEVGPESTVRVPLLVPFFPPVFGNNLRVAIDGRNQDDPVRLSQRISSAGYGGRRGSYGYGGGYFSPAGGPLVPLVLVSQRVAAIEDFMGRISPNIKHLVPVGAAGGGGGPGMGGPGMGGPGGARMGGPGGPGGMGGPPGAVFGPGPEAFDPFAGRAGGAGPPGGGPPGVKGGAPGPEGPPPPEEMWVSSLATQVVSSEVPVSSWLTTWLGYSRYDGIVVTGDELGAAPAGVQAALWQYAETGGSLLVLGNARVPESWKKWHKDEAGVEVYQVGLGKALVCGKAGYPAWKAQRWSVIASAWMDTVSNPWFQIDSATIANSLLRVVDDAGIPVGGLFTLMLLFTLVIGPLNLWLLGRKGRRLWMLWTVPSISLVTCLAVFGYMLLVEGWQGHLRTEGVTILDENAQRATSLGLTGFYAPMAPGDGLHFSRDSEVVWQKGDDYGYHYRDRGSSAACAVDWSQDQHFASGWVSARVPSHFKVRKSEVPRRERLTVHRRPDGTLSAVNGLGAPILQLWLADERGQVHTAEEVAPGAEATLTPRGDLPAVKQGSPPLRNLTQSNTWLTPAASTVSPSFRRITPAVSMKKAASPAPAPAPAPAGTSLANNPTGWLSPRGYVAILDGAPFFEEALRNARTRKGRNIVIGILKEADDAH
jgi:hypothetical protein